MVSVALAGLASLSQPLLLRLLPLIVSLHVELAMSYQPAVAALGAAGGEDEQEVCCCCCV